MSKPKLLAVQLETCHENPDSTAWYAYFNGELTVGEDIDDEEFMETIQIVAKLCDKAPLGLAFDDELTEVPNQLSQATGLRRYWVASAH